jgi:LPS-assembly lipoprotein
MLKHAGVIVLLALLSGCGFTLRGTAQLPEAMQPLYVDVTNTTAMTRELVRVFSDNHTALAPDAGSARYRLDVAGETSNERAISVNATARAGEYELTMGVQFQLRRGAEVVLGPQALSTSKVYLADPENAVAKNEEAELIRTEMRKELAQQILRRLQAVKL